jgi:hypothetical protein
MRTMTLTLALGAMPALSTAAQADRDHRATHLIRVPVVTPSDPLWVPDYNIVPRYRYRPQDDRLDTSPYAKPVAPGDAESGGYRIGQ